MTKVVGALATWVRREKYPRQGRCAALLLHFLHPSFLQLQVCDDDLKSGLGQHGKIRSGVAEILIQADSESAKHELVRHLSAYVAELVSELLEAHAVVIDGGAA